MNKLSIGIPTYNRDYHLESNLLKMMDDLVKYNVNIYLFDDSPNDLTKDLVRRLNHPNIFYQKNIPSLGHDKNCLEVLRNCNSEYIWYLGDYNYITSEGFYEVLKAIDEKEYSAIVVSTKNRNISIESTTFDDKDDFFVKLGWHTTLTGVTIYNKKLIDQVIKKVDLKKFYNSNFMQLAILLEGLNLSNVGIKFINESYISEYDLKPGEKTKKSYWFSKPIDTFVVDWYNFIMSITDGYSLNDKIEVIKSHDINQKLFNPINLIELRANGYISYNDYKLNKDKADSAIALNKFVLKSILLLPIPIARGLNSTKKLIKRGLNG